MLTVDEVGNVIHRPRAVEGIHGYQVLESGGLQLAQILLHARGLELERSDGAALAVKFVRRGIVYVDGVDIHRLALGMLHVGHGILYDRQGLETEKVHLYKARILDNRTLVLRDEHLFARLLVVGRAHGHPVGYVVAADDGSARVHARVADVAFQHAGILYCVAQYGILRILGSLQLGHVIYRIGEIYLLVGNAFGH